MVYQHDRFQLAWLSADSIISTDRSAAKDDSVSKGDGKGLNPLASDIFCRALELILHVDSSGQGATKTISRV